MNLELQYIPYILYVISPGSRFERDKKVFFDPDGEVSRGQPLINYGWYISGFKELIEAFYLSRHGTTKDFDKYYETRILGHRGNIVIKLKRDGLIPANLRGFIELRFKQNVAVPVLYVELNNIYYRFCDDCPIAFQTKGFPARLANFLEKLNLLSTFKHTFQCTRQICKCLCDYYKDCVLSYTSTEGYPDIERRKEDCLIDLFKQMMGVPGVLRYEHILKQGIQRETVPNAIGGPRRCRVCVERFLRFDFTPLRYFFFDPKTWSKMKQKRYNKKGARPNFNAIPADLISDFLSGDEYFEGAGLQASRRREGVLECFLKISEIRFEIKYDLTPHDCSICNQTHRITGIPIKAMFRDDVVFIHEAKFAELLWHKLWQRYPDEFCGSFDGIPIIKADQSKVLRREMKVGEIATGSLFSQHSYDYAIDMSKLDINKNRLLLFDLTTGLWKKSGFHEEARMPEQHLDIWTEMLYKIPLARPDAIAIWYVLIDSTEETFFDGTAPAGATNMDQLLAAVTSNDLTPVNVVRTIDEALAIDPTLHKLVVIPIFKTPQQKRAFITEIDRLKRKRFDQLLISKVVDLLLN